MKVEGRGGLIQPIGSCLLTQFSSVLKSHPLMWHVFCLLIRCLCFPVLASHCCICISLLVLSAIVLMLSGGRRKGWRPTDQSRTQAIPIKAPLLLILNFGTMPKRYHLHDVAAWCKPRTAEAMQANRLGERGPPMQRKQLPWEMSSKNSVGFVLFIQLCPHFYPSLSGTNCPGNSSFRLGYG